MKCPNCNSDNVRPDGRHYFGAEVQYCPDCGSWFTRNGDSILFQSDGGDDVPDEIALNLIDDERSDD